MYSKKMSDYTAPPLLIYRYWVVLWGMIQCINLIFSLRILLLGRFRDLPFPITHFPILVFISILNISGLYAVWRLKRWGLVLLFFTAIVGVGNSYFALHQWANALYYGLNGFVVLCAFLLVGGRRRPMRYLD